MTREELFNRIIFESDKEKTEAEFYTRVKGVAIHQKILCHLVKHLSTQEHPIRWEQVSALLRYDKKLRDKIYIYLATLEEYIRAYISNKFEDSPNQPFWKDFKCERAKINKRINLGEKVSDVLESIDFGDIIRQVMALPSHDIYGMFENNCNIKQNLNAVRVLRNAVSHHVFLMEYDLLECVVDGKTCCSLEQNIMNLRQLLPREYRYGKNGKGGITSDINNCRFENILIDEVETRKLMNLSRQDIITI